MTNYAQGQGPYSGAVQPPGSLITMQEEFTSGLSPGFAPATSQWGARWLPWTPATVGGDVLRYLEAVQQRAIIYGPEPGIAPDPGSQWYGAILPFPAVGAIAFTEEDPDDALAWFTIFAGVGFGPGQLLGGLNVQKLASAALIVSATNLNASPDGTEFVTLGADQLNQPNPVVPPAIPWFSRARLARYTNSQGLPFDEFIVPTAGATGLLFRADIIIEREGLGTLIDPFTYESQLSGMFSSDGGASWQGLGDVLIKGGPDPTIEVPRSVGFGCSGFLDTLNNFSGNEATGSFDFLRVYQRPVSEASIILNPDGGRNWP